MNQETHFQPQLDQKTLAQMIDRDGLKWEYFTKGSWWPGIPHQRAADWQRVGYEIRVDPDNSVAKMVNFQPQLSQHDLAEMIDREGLPFEVNSQQGIWTSGYTLNIKATSFVEGGCKIRLAPGALTKFGLKPGMVPHNPDGLTAERITKGGKYRAVTIEELDGRFGQDKQNCAEVFNAGIWFPSLSGTAIKDTIRVPVNTPFPKAQISRVDPKSTPERSERAYHQFHGERALSAAKTDKEHYRERLEQAQIELQSQGKGGFEQMKIEQQEEEIQVLKEQRSSLIQENENLKSRIAELETHRLDEQCNAIAEARLRIIARYEHVETWLKQPAPEETLANWAGIAEGLREARRIIGAMLDELPVPKPKSIIDHDTHIRLMMEDQKGASK